MDSYITRLIWKLSMKKKPIEKNTTRSNVKNRRDKKRYPNILSQYTLKMKQDLVDYDYLDKLNDKELEFLDKFTRDWVHAKMDRKNLKKNTLPTKEWKQECDRKNNAWKNDLFTRAKAGGKFYSIDDLNKAAANPEELEPLNNLNNSKNKRRKTNNTTK